MLWEHNATVLFLTQNWNQFFGARSGVELLDTYHDSASRCFLLSCCVFVRCRFSVISCLQGVSFGEASLLAGTGNAQVAHVLYAQGVDYMQYQITSQGDS